MWTDIEQTLARIDSMDAGAAAGDAAEIRRIVTAAKAVGERLVTVFASQGVLSGAAADASTTAGVALGTHVQTSVAGLESGAGALDDAAGALAASIAQRERIAALTGATRTPEIRIAARTAVHAMMAGSYNIPMSSSTTGIADPSGPSSGAERTGGPGTTSDPNSAATVPTVPGTSAVQASGAGVSNDSGASTLGAAGSDPAAPQPAASPSSAPSTAGDAASNGVGQATSPTATAGTGSGPTGSAPAGSGPTGPGPGGSGPAGSGVSGSVVGTSARTVSTPVRDGDGLSPTTPGTIVPGGMPIPGLGGTASPSVAAGSPQSQTAGTARPIAYGSPTAAQSSAASAASRGTGASPAMGPGAVRRQDDEEHTAADYLRSAREGELLLGTAPLVTPAVLPPPVESGDERDVAVDGEVGGVRDDADQELDPTL
ncbi:hypothetical protein L5G32_04540 [Gordonia sp. HY002]|uniref:hypothetical protein n=1 Tax=Gordonia zhenghanii TaxID=2911516 RepID=UPI001EF15BA2|nr:hypothetical protein [Gordonia zhenghanii]MCF8569530.1 hypothetical protein [Gordonia zhenghanii]MCF8603889.1 hypothetical protein [Gordonia zhenghanii]